MNWLPLVLGFATVMLMRFKMKFYCNFNCKACCEIWIKSGPFLSYCLFFLITFFDIMMWPLND